MSRMSQSEFETRGAVDVFKDSISKVGFASDHFKLMGKAIPKHGKRVKEALRNLWVTELHAPCHLIAQFLVGH